MWLVSDINFIYHTRKIGRSNWIFHAEVNFFTGGTKENIAIPMKFLERNLLLLCFFKWFYLLELFLIGTFMLISDKEAL